MEENRQYWEDKLSEYQEALASEFEMDEVNDSMIRYLKFSIEECLEQLM
jgi:hypothetical protein